MQLNGFVHHIHGLVFAATVDGRWHPGIGDPTPMGWITTVAYALAGLLCMWAAWQTWREPPTRPGRRATFFWALCGLLMLFLSVNKQLDLQTFFTQVARDAAKTQGWYQGRRLVQIWFIRSLAAGGVLCLLFVAWFIRGARLSYYLALVGLVFTGSFVVIRAASFHHVDAIIGYEIAGIRMNWVFELGGILVVGASAMAFRESTKREKNAIAPNEGEPEAGGEEIPQTPEQAVVSSNSGDVKENGGDSPGDNGASTTDDGSAADGGSLHSKAEDSPVPDQHDGDDHEESEGSPDCPEDGDGGDDDNDDDLPDIIVLDS